MKRRIFYNGIILTMNKAESTAAYVLTEGDKVAAVGSAAEIEKHIAEGAEPVNLQGRLMLPGFIDSHIHMLTAALNRLKLDISAMKFDTVDDMLAYIRQKKEGSQDPWISVFGFSEENIRASRMVTQKDIDRFFPDVPVTIIRVCGHMSVINTKAMEQLDRDKMERISEGGVWSCFIAGKIKPFDLYKYCVKTQKGKEVMKSDPYAFHCETRPGNASKYYELSGYEFKEN